MGFVRWVRGENPSPLSAVDVGFEADTPVRGPGSSQGPCLPLWELQKTPGMGRPLGKPKMETHSLLRIVHISFCPGTPQIPLMISICSHPRAQRTLMFISEVTQYCMEPGEGHPFSCFLWALMAGLPVSVLGPLRVLLRSSQGLGTVHPLVNDSASIHAFSFLNFI